MVLCSVDVVGLSFRTAFRSYTAPNSPGKRSRVEPKRQNRTSAKSSPLSLLNLSLCLSTLPLNCPSYRYCLWISTCAPVMDAERLFPRPCRILQSGRVSARVWILILWRRKRRERRLSRSLQAASGNQRPSRKCRMRGEHTLNQVVVWSLNRTKLYISFFI